MRSSEANILIRVEQMIPRHRHARYLAQIAQLDYNYVCRILGEMKAKGWLTGHKRGLKVFYNITESAPMRDAYESSEPDGSLNRRRNTDFIEEQSKLKDGN